MKHAVYGSAADAVFAGDLTAERRRDMERFINCDTRYDRPRLRGLRFFNGGLLTRQESRDHRDQDCANHYSFVSRRPGPPWRLPGWTIYVLCTVLFRGKSGPDRQEISPIHRCFPPCRSGVFPASPGRGLWGQYKAGDMLAGGSALSIREITTCLAFEAPFINGIAESPEMRQRCASVDHQWD
jgi:hypothetical protein